MRLRILHLSDLHERAERETEPWRRRRVLGDAWEDNLTELLQDGPIDLVCFTGDAADWGLRSEFNAAAEFLKALLERLRLPKERLFVVPGNHDIERPVHADAWKELRVAAGKAQDIELARWLHGGKETPFGFRKKWRPQVFERLANYRAWVRDDLGRPELLPTAADSPQSYRVSLEIRGFRIHIAGFDSAWLCGDDNDAGHLRLTDQQVMGRLTEGGRPLDGFRLALVHHPFDDLAVADRKVVRAHLAENADLLLRGHLHEPELSSWVDPDDRPLRQVAAGCLYEGHGADRYRNGCQSVTLELNPDGTAARAEVRFRSFSPAGGHFHDDPSLYRESPAGRLRFALARRRQRTSVTNPFDPRNPAVPPRFVGREPELRRLEASLQESAGVSIVGDWRIGKTSLLRTWEQKLRDLGREVVFVDGQGPEGASIAALVGKIVGKPSPESADQAADQLAAWAFSLPSVLPPVLLIDELDGIVPRFDPRFFERLRNLLGQILIVVASRQPVDLLYQEAGRTSPFHNRLRMMQLGLLSADAAEALRSTEGVLDSEERRLLDLWAGDHPFYIQLFGHCLLEAKHFGESREQALDRFLVEAFARLRELWARLSEREQAALRTPSTGLRSLQYRGLVTAAGQPFGKVLSTWLEERG